jgi:universal stress protein A
MKKRTRPRRAAQRSAPKPARQQAAATRAGSPRAIQSLGIRSILVPIDFSIHSKKALKYAVPLAAQSGASLRLIYVVEPTVYPADLGFGQVVLPGVEDELRQKGAAELAELIETEIGDRVPASATVRTGTPSKEILAEAEEKSVDLIVVATHGHSGVEHMLFGSTAERIVRKAHCPVLTIRPTMGGEA